MSYVEFLVDAVIWIYPAYVANAIPALLGYGKPLDGGRMWKDGRPIFGPGKTVRGFGTGILAGTLVGMAMGTPALGFMLALGALLGDLGGSFVKRRLGKERGAPAWGLDQSDFLIGAVLLGLLVNMPQWEVLILILVVTPLAHLATNIGAHFLDLKKEPW